MWLLDDQNTKVRFYEVRRLTAWLRLRGYEPEEGQGVDTADGTSGYFSP